MAGLQSRLDELKKGLRVRSPALQRTTRGYRIRLLLSPVVVPENKASDGIDLEYQLQRIMRSSC
jgi:hypothetical protein